MSIEKDIQQKKFHNEFQKVIVNTIFSGSWMEEKMKDFLKSEDITTQQYNILRILRGSKGPLSTAQIRERMLDKMSDTSRLTERLLKKGLIKKSNSLTDKRLVDVSITNKGLKTLAKLDNRTDELDKIAAALTKEEAVLLNKLLDKLRLS
jgi:DNA-binding MarR family transcriptional regulator